MRDIACQIVDCLNVLSLAKLLFEQFAIGNILQDSVNDLGLTMRDRFRIVTLDQMPYLTVGPDNAILHAIRLAVLQSGTQSRIQGGLIFA